MSRAYSPRTVLLHLPLDLIRQFLAVEEIVTGAGWANLAGDGARAVYRAWLDLPTGPREQVEQMLQAVHELATSAGVAALIEEARFQHRDITAALAAIPEHHARALWVRINHPDVFRTARLLFSVARPFGRYWNLNVGFSGSAPDTSPPAVEALREAVAELYRKRQGRGHHCTVEEYRRNGSLYLFAYIDDYAQTHTAHDDHGNLASRPLRPTFEVVFVYHPSRGSLDLFAPGERRLRGLLRELFCEHVLRGEVPEEQPGAPPYRLAGLLSRSFALPPEPAAGITSATIKRLKVIPPNRARRVVLEADPSNRRDVYDMLDQHFPADKFARDHLQVEQVTFAVRYHPAGGGRERSLTFDVALPDACSLRSMSDEQREIGERCLRLWGILREQRDDGTAESDRVA